MLGRVMRPALLAMKPHSLKSARLLLALALAAGSAMAADDCEVPPEAWQPRSAVSALAQRNGWQVDRLKIDDGCYEVVGRDAEGRRIKAKIHPASLQVIKVKRGRHEREHEREHERDRERERAGAGPRATASAPASAP